MSKQLELFPEMLWEDVEYQGKTYRRYTGGGQTPYRIKEEMKINLQRFIDEYNKKTIQ
jgi:hypothetical protein